MSVTFRVSWEDFDYEGWAEQLGLTATLEPSGEGDFLLHVEGEQDNIEQFSNELGWEPISVNNTN